MPTLSATVVFTSKQFLQAVQRSISLLDIIYTHGNTMGGKLEERKDMGRKKGSGGRRRGRKIRIWYSHPGSYFSNKYFSACLQVAIISDLSFSRLSHSGYNIIANFPS